MERERTTHRVDWAEVPAGQFVARVALVDGYRLAAVGSGDTWFWRFSRDDRTLVSGSAVSLYAATTALERLLAQQSWADISATTDIT